MWGFNPQANFNQQKEKGGKSQKKKMASGRANFTRGNLFAMNFQAGSYDLPTDAQGDGTASVTFAKPMNGIPEVVLTPKEALTTGVSYYYGATKSGFVMGIDGASEVSGTVSVSYMAFDDAYN